MMADGFVKEQKLAAARKKLRKYQKKKDLQKTSQGNESPSLLEVFNTQQSETSSSRSSSVTDVSESGICRQEHFENKPDSVLSSSHENLRTYNIIAETNTNVINNETESNKVTKNVPYELSVESFVANQSNQSFVENEEHFNLSNSHHEKNVSDFKQDVQNDLIMEPNKVFEMSSNCDKNDSLEYEGSTCSETNASVTTVLQVKNLDSHLNSSHNVPLRSTAESLRQLSLQMSGLINHSNEQEPLSNPSDHEETIKELEKRNAELASLLEQEQQKTFENNLFIDEMKRKIDSQSSQIEALQKLTATDDNGTEINRLKEQLQVHIQTIGILVAEKSELQTSLSHFRYSLDQKTGEISELQGRLDASREHVKHLEESMQELKDKISLLSDSQKNDTQQIENFRSNNAKLSKLCEEMRASTAELTERLTVRSEENQKLNNELTEVRRQYELSQVLIEQLRTNTVEDAKTQLEHLQLAYTNSQSQIQAVQAALEEARNEKQQLDFEYKSFTTQLVNDMEHMKEKLSTEMKKREEFEGRAKDLEADFKSREEHSKSKVSLEQMEEEKNRLHKIIADMTESKKLFEDKCSSLARDNGQLSQLLAEQSSKLEALETAADRHSFQEIDTTQLLQTMQSDKIAAARALSQNKQLKEQLEELQNGFIMMSNKKLELTEKLEKEMHVKKGLLREITKLNEELSSHKEILLAKQKELEAVKNAPATSIPQHLSVKLTNETVCTSGHINGNHQHDHDHNAHSHSNTEHLEEAHREQDLQVDQRTPIPHTETYECKTSDKTSVEAPMVERAQEATESPRKEDSEDASSSFNKSPEKDDLGPARVSSNEAHEALEKRFLQCMKDLAAMSDEKQNLEHLVQQLQLETETIGDYITIYQFQRGVMKQQMQELKTELDLLKTEKKDVVSKLSKLQKLVENLASDKDGLKEGFIHGINSIISSSTPTEKSTDTQDVVQESENCPPETDQPQVTQGDVIPVHETASAPETKSITTKTDTVKQIMELISEMETTTQLDMAALHKFHPCSHCSGRLLTI